MQCCLLLYTTSGEKKTLVRSLRPQLWVPETRTQDFKTCHTVVSQTRRYGLTEEQLGLWRPSVLVLDPDSFYKGPVRWFDHSEPSAPVSCPFPSVQEKMWCNGHFHPSFCLSVFVCCRSHPHCQADVFRGFQREWALLMISRLNKEEDVWMFTVVSQGSCEIPRFFDGFQESLRGEVQGILQGLPGILEGVPWILAE